MNKKEQIVKRVLQIPTVDLKVREAAEGEESRVICGYAIVFNVPSNPLWSDEESEAREVITPEAITKELLDGCDIKLTMFHNRQLILGRSRQGSGTLTYKVDDKGVWFECEMPKTVDGDKALELVRRGDLTGCSFMFGTRYYDDACVERSAKVVNGVTMIEYRIKAVTGVYDFTIAADPYYPDTSAEAREFVRELKQPTTDPEDLKKVEEKKEKMQKQLREMRRAATQSIV